MKETSVTTLLVSYTETPGQEPLLVVAKMAVGVVPEVVNAVQGTRATDIYKSLINGKG